MIYVGTRLWCGYGVTKWCCLVDGCCESDLFVDDKYSIEGVVDVSR